MSKDYRVLHLTRENDPLVPAGAYTDPRLKWIYRVRLKTTIDPKEVSGIEKLKQRIILLMLGSPGTDIWDTQKGGGLLEIFGQSFSTQEDVLKDQLSFVVMSTESQILEEQQLLDLPADETLVSLDLTRIRLGDKFLDPIEVNWEETEAIIRPTVRTAAGQIEPFELEFTV